MRVTKSIILLALAAFFLFGSFIIPRFFRTSSKLEQQVNELYLENQSLRVKLTANLPAPPAAGPVGSSEFKIANVYSSYPFNDKNAIAIALGSDDGIQESMPVVLGSDVLIGQVVKVYEKYSLVQTVFDPGWRLAVRIGAGNINALLEGGVEPHLTTIDKNKLVKEGEFVYSAAKGFPYGALIGKVEKIISSPSAIFQEAEVNLPYDFNNEIAKVKVLISYVR